LYACTQHHSGCSRGMGQWHGHAQAEHSWEAWDNIVVYDVSDRSMHEKKIFFIFSKEQCDIYYIKFWNVKHLNINFIIVNFLLFIKQHKCVLMNNYRRMLLTHCSTPMGSSIYYVTTRRGALLVTFGDRGGRGQAAVVTSPQTQK